MKKETFISGLQHTGLLDAIGDPLSIQDRDFRVLYQNRSHIDIVGNRTGEFCYKAYQGKDVVCVGCHLVLSFEDGKTHKVERSRTVDGKTVYTENTASPIFDSQGTIIAGIELIRDITAQKQSEIALQESRDKLEMRVRERTLELEEINTALKVLLHKREQDQNVLEDNMLSNIKNLIQPYLTKLKANRSMSEDLVYLNIIEKNLGEIVSPFSSRLSFHQFSLTPREIMVANLIKDGKQDKEIAEIMNISLETVKSHRQNIRKKLGIYGKRDNLRSKLLAFSE